MLSRAKTVALAGLTALALGGAAIGTATPASAQYWRWHHYHPYYHHWGWFPGAVVGGLVGGTLAGVFGAPYYYPYPYPYDYYGYYPYW